MKRRSIEPSSSSAGADEDPAAVVDEEVEADKKKKKKKQQQRMSEADVEMEVVGEEETAPLAADLGEDLVYEVLKRADARTLGRAACVSRRWRRLAEDERLWEAVCTPHWASIGCGNQQLRSVVLALGGFRRLHSLYMVPLRPGQAAPRLPLPFAARRSQQRWGKDEVQLSLSLLSIGFFEKMNHQGFKPGGGSGCR